LEKFVIRGGKPLKGEVYISGAKNAAVALVAATILCDEPCILENVPEISDITKCLKILKEMGAQVELLDRHTIKIDTKGITKPVGTWRAL
jgi:UDP-N-acetylglucosamine 1-carboxyvinyltransferase